MTLALLASLAVAATLALPADAPAQAEGDLRLVDGATANEGRLEVFHAGEWGTVCHDAFGGIDATVACGQLGLPTPGIRVFPGTFAPGVGPIWMDDVLCTGTEARLVDCLFGGFGVHDCVHAEDVGIDCMGPGCGNEVIEDGETCEAGDDSACDVRCDVASCRCEPSACGNGVLEPGEECDGDELGDCPGGTCDSSCFCEAVGCSTYEPDTCASSAPSGCRCDGDCGTAPGCCADYCDACNGANATYCPFATCGNDVIETGEECDGTDIGVCPSGSCDPDCTCPDTDDGALRLADSPFPNEGRIELFHAGQWGTVCDDSFGDDDAGVACRQLGVGDGGVVLSNAEGYGQGDDPIWMDEVACLGSEDRLVDCPFDGFGNNDCSHSEDVSVRCFTCGNGVLEPGEVCDGDDPGECPTGACGASCQCPDPVCGNDVLEPGEECDGLADGDCDPGTCDSSCLCEAVGCSADGAGVCEGQSSDGCFCDSECVDFGDCCTDACDFCRSCSGPCDGVSYVAGDCNASGGFDAGDPVCAVLCLIAQAPEGADCTCAADCNCSAGLDAGDPVCTVRRLIDDFDPDTCVP